MIRSLLEYNRFANNAFTYSLKSNEVQDEQALVLMSHIINAQHIWNARILGEKPNVSVWQKHSFHELNVLNEEGFTKSIEIMGKLNPTTAINYKNTKGHDFVKSVQDVLLHITNHSTYHRGQVAMRLKELGLQPPASDYIFYSKEKE